MTTPNIHNNVPIITSLLFFVFRELSNYLIFYILSFHLLLVNSFDLNRPVILYKKKKITLHFVTKINYLKKFSLFEPVRAYKINESFYGSYSDYLYHCIIDRIWSNIANKIPKNCPTINGFNSKYGICMGIDPKSKSIKPISFSSMINSNINHFQPYSNLYNNQVKKNKN